jgi:hypothetical protein
MALITSFATSTGSRTGAKKGAGVLMPAKSGVVSWPGVTRRVFIVFWWAWRSSAVREAWRARRADLEDV